MTAASPRLNGPHDLGGVQGLGPIPISGSDRLFSQPWEGRVHGTMLSAAVSRAFTVDEARARVEELHPIAYVTMSYYEQWLYALETNLVAHDVLSVEEIETRLREIAADPDAPLPERRNDELVGVLGYVIEHGIPVLRDVDAAPRFGLGDGVRTRIVHLGAPGVQHTRLPGYVQGKPGVVEALYGATLLPDAVVAGEGEHPEHLYRVRFRSRDLWPEAGSRDSVTVDLWESYLEPAGAAS